MTSNPATIKDARTYRGRRAARLATPDLKVLSHMYRQAWRSGLKTTNYLRTLGASGIEKATVASKAEVRGHAGTAAGAAGAQAEVRGQKSDVSELNSETSAPLPDLLDAHSSLPAMHIFNHHRWLLATAASFALCTWGCQSTNKPINMSPQPDVHFAMLLARQSYVLGRPIKFSIKVQNASPVPIRLPTSNGHAVYYLNVADSKGRSVSSTELGNEFEVPFDPSDYVPADSIAIPCGQTYKTEADLTQLYKLEAGSYQITFEMGYIRLYPDHMTYAKVTFDSLKFDVTK